MSLFQHYTQFQHRLNASKHPQHDGDLDDMSFFAQSACPLPLESSTPNTRLQTSREELDDYLTSDLDASFTSTMSIQSPEPLHATLVPEDTSVDLMDISPLPPSQSQWDKFSVPKSSRSRAFTTATGRTFGNDMSNSPPKKDTTSQMRRTQRGTLPSEWMTSARIHEPASKTVFEPVCIPQLQCGPGQPHSYWGINQLTVLYSRQPPQDLPLLDSDDAMDIDTSFVAVEKLLIPGGTSPPLSPSPSPPPLELSAAPTVTQLNTLFYGTESPIHSPAASPESQSRARVQPFPEPEPTPRSSSPVLHSSPSVRKLERIRSGPMPPRIGKPSLLNMGKAKVPRKAHRPTLSATIPPSDYQSLRSACPNMASRQSTDLEASGLLPPARRAVSAMFPPPGYPNLPSDDLFDSPNNSSPAQAHAIRQQFKPKRKSSGADELRHLKGVTPMMQRNTPPGSSTRFASPGLPGFGDNEAHGKILPCHRVTEDGLMRITAKTVRRSVP
jgi:M-phase inducer tyrosine phosphatase